METELGMPEPLESPRIKKTLKNNFQLRQSGVENFRLGPKLENPGFQESQRPMEDYYVRLVSWFCRNR